MAKVKKNVFPNIENYRLVPNLDNAISNFECDAKVLVSLFNKESIDDAEVYDRIEWCRTDLEKIERGIPDLEEVALKGEDSYSASAKKSKVKKGNNGQKCVNYLGMPVCPECGSPNLVEGRMEGDVTPCVCSRCYAKCWFNETDFDTGYGADHLRYRNGEVPESFIKSDKQKSETLFSDMLKKQRTKNIMKMDNVGQFLSQNMFTLMSIKTNLEIVRPRNSSEKYDKMLEAYKKFYDEYVECVDYYSGNDVGKGQRNKNKLDYR